jgi:predicted GIY-YIG superfamily endonuclease
MNERFGNLIELEPRFAALLAAPPVNYGALPSGLPRRAIYLFSEGDRHLYVGRTNHLRSRLRGHCAHPHFKKVFAEMRGRVSEMHIRFVEETDPIKQALLEIYAAYVLETPYNDFENH